MDFDTKGAKVLVDTWRKRVLNTKNTSWLSNLKSLNKFLVFSVFTDSNFQISGPLLPITLWHHSMVRLGKGQAILGGRGGNSIYHAKIYSMTCSNRNCIISLLDRELSVPKSIFVAIPIPDTISGCITGGKNYIPKITPKSSTKLVQWIIL